jgi:uncharacterized protein (UPF0332 family)
MELADKRALVQHRLDTARDELEAAQILLDAGKYRKAVSGAYYAVFHIASAALLWHDQERAKHSGIESQFGFLLIKSGKIEEEYGRIYMKARRERERSDYDVLATPPVTSEAAASLSEAQRFVERLERYLREVGALE